MYIIVYNSNVLCAHLPHDWVLYGVEVHRAFVGEVIEHISGPHRLGSPLLVPEDQVNPLVKLARHELRLKGLAGEGGRMNMRTCVKWMNENKIFFRGWRDKKTTTLLSLFFKIEWINNEIESSWINKRNI